VNFRVPDSDSEMVWLTIGDEKPLLTNMVIR
jgi:hypothetical protein